MIRKKRSYDEWEKAEWDNKINISICMHTIHFNLCHILENVIKRGREKEQFHENHKADVFHSFMKKEIEVEIAITAISLSIVFKYYSSSSTFVL